MNERNFKHDARPKRGSWAPGNYMGKCYKCKEGFIGDKRALICADCAYAAPETAPVSFADIFVAPAPALREAQAEIERLNAALFRQSDELRADLSAARMKVENLEAEVARLTRERDEAFKADGFHWSDTKHVPGTSIVSGGAMLLAADGHCVGLVTVLQCESEAVRVDVERALASASNPAKMRRFINAARSGEAEANERAEKGEAERDAALAQRDRLREALTNMLALFGSPHSDEYCDGGASYRLAVKTVEDARAALSEDKS